MIDAPFIVVVCGVLASLAIPIAAMVFIMKRPNLGYLAARRRARIVREGTDAEATILSTRLEKYFDEHGQEHAEKQVYWLVYEVHPPGGASFRARGREDLDPLQAAANHVEEGARVRVRFDAHRDAVVLERVPSESLRDRAEQRERERIALLKRERELLRGRPDE
jgi:hypothetical protein